MNGCINNDSLTNNLSGPKTGSLRKLWSFSLFMFIVCNIAFSSKTYLMMMNSYALYFFLGVSLLCMLLSGEVKLNLFLVSMICFMVVMLLGCVYSTSVYMVDTTYNFFVAFCIMFCIVNYIKTDSDIKFVFFSVMIGGLALNLYILSIYGSDFIDAIMSQTRVGDVAGNANDVGLKSCFSGLIALYFILKDKQKRSVKILYMLLCLGCIFFALITASRQVVILLAIGLFYLFMLKEKKHFSVYLRNTLIAVLLVITVIYIIYNVRYFDYLRVRIDEFLDLIANGSGTESDSKRMRFLSEGIGVFLRNPIFGDGTAASYNYFSTYSHSNLVELLMNHGIVGCFVYYFAFPVAVIECINRKRTGKDPLNIASLCIFMFISMVALSFTLVYYSSIYYQILFAVAAAFGFQSSDEKRQLRKN